jgi:cephalosporin-C deacetylase
VATASEIETFVSSVVRPPDFDSFWEGTLADLGNVPLEPELLHVPLRSTPEVNVYEVHYLSLGGIRIAGWYCVPARGTGPFPALIQFPGYKGEPGLPRNWAQRGVVTLSVAVRGKLRSHDRVNPGYPGVLTSGVESPDTYAYRGIISDCARGIDFLLSRPEVDKDRIFAHGSSQGGGLTLITTALRPEIKGGASACPFLCAFPDAMRLARTYPYNELNCYLRAYPDRGEQVLTTLSYYDAVNFTSRIHCPMAVGIPMEDAVCPPETQYAAYRNLAGPKEVWLIPDAAHGSPSEYQDRERDWLENLIGLSG